MVIGNNSSTAAALRGGSLHKRAQNVVAQVESNTLEAPGAVVGYFYNVLETRILRIKLYSKLDKALPLRTGDIVRSASKRKTVYLKGWV